MQLMKKWLILTLILVIPIFGQVKKKKSKSTKLKKKNEIEFSNEQNTQDYLDMLEEAFYKVRESYVDSVNESEIIKSDIDNDLLFVKGSIPGSKNCEVLVKKAVKNIKKLTVNEKMEVIEKLKQTPDKKKKK